MVTIVDLALFLPWLSVTVRRLHDIGRSGWWLLMLSAGLAVSGAIAGFAVVAICRFERYDLTALIMAILCLLVAGVTFLVFMVTPGTQRPNEYGADPNGASDLEEVFA